MPNRPKRHHQVPRAYLNRFGVGETVKVRWRDGKRYETNTLNVAVESGFYTMPDQPDRSPTWVEDALAVADDDAAKAMAAIDRTGGLPVDGSKEHTALATFVALQFTRTTGQREQVMFPERLAAWAGQRTITEDLVAEYLERVHLGFPPRPREAEAAHLYVSKVLEDGPVPTARAIELMLGLAEVIVPGLLRLHWTLELDRNERFITSDVPVVVWHKPSRMDEFRGIGIETTTELRLPLDPGKQLVLSKRPRVRVLPVAPHRVAHSNADMADGCHRFLVGRPGQRTVIDGLRLDARPPVARFNVGPLLVEGPDGSKVRDSEVLHVFVPRRPQHR
jgi:hypothetical protein